MTKNPHDKNPLTKPPQTKTPHNKNPLTKTPITKFRQKTRILLFQFFKIITINFKYNKYKYKLLFVWLHNNDNTKSHSSILGKPLNIMNNSTNIYIMFTYFRVHMTVITQLSTSFVAPNDFHDWELVCNIIENVKQLFIELCVIFQAMTHFLETQTTPTLVACTVAMSNCSLSVARNSHVGHLPMAMTHTSTLFEKGECGFSVWIW